MIFTFLLHIFTYYFNLVKSKGVLGHRGGSEKKPRGFRYTCEMFLLENIIIRVLYWILHTVVALIDIYLSNFDPLRIFTHIGLFLLMASVTHNEQVYLLDEPILDKDVAQYEANREFIHKIITVVTILAFVVKCYSFCFQLFDIGMPCASFVYWFMTSGVIAIVTSFITELLVIKYDMYGLTGLIVTYALFVCLSVLSFESVLILTGAI
ncbi:hypothetical protein YASMINEVIRUS_1450 [Yasminevirus sp. GU-2018]|uniref:Uncharacterized protein n=1 Tax=Yasminevirus sp. GU-2018 TaxID=2420051 RepID=A0A5K0UA78_9VIRU|nr:hypothetical protein YASMINEVIRUS_1450 [Yasminevirus sp. GU-2018]